VQGDKLLLTAKKCFVLDAPQAAVIVVSAQVDGAARLIAVTADQLPEGALVRETVIDETRRSYTLEVDALALPADQLLPGADFASIEHAALLLLSAEMSGGLAGVLHVIIDYLTTRKQFDQYIGSYQSLKHPTVQILLSMEACRSHVYRAATPSRKRFEWPRPKAAKLSPLLVTAPYSFMVALASPMSATRSCFCGARFGVSTSLEMRPTTEIY
jgi:alkylation response protein AidB-like acyl-CoA dehydrogenase